MWLFFEADTERYNIWLFYPFILFWLSELSICKLMHRWNDERIDLSTIYYLHSTLSIHISIFFCVIWWTESDSIAFDVKKEKNAKMIKRLNRPQRCKNLGKKKILKMLPLAWMRIVFVFVSCRLVHEIEFFFVIGLTEYID